MKASMRSMNITSKNGNVKKKKNNISLLYGMCTKIRQENHYQLIQVVVLMEARN